MTTDQILSAIRALPEHAQVTLTVRKGDLLRGLEASDERPDRIVTTVWCAQNLGMSRQWWADACRTGEISEAFQEAPGAPWYLPIGAATRHIRNHAERQTPRRRRRRGPRKAEGRT